MTAQTTRKTAWCVMKTETGRQVAPLYPTLEEAREAVALFSGTTDLNGYWICQVEV